MAIRRVDRVAIFVAFALVIMVPPTAIGQQPIAAKTVAIEVGDNMRFTPAVIHARPGEPVHVILRSTTTKPKATFAHNFVLLKRGTNARKFVNRVSAPHELDVTDPAVKEDVIVATPLVGIGETQEVTFEAPTRAGDYEFVCTFDGHFNLGMHGRLVVK